MGNDGNYDDESISRRVNADLANTIEGDKVRGFSLLNGLILIFCLRRSYRVMIRSDLLRSTV